MGPDQSELQPRPPETPTPGEPTPLGRGSVEVLLRATPAPCLRRRCSRSINDAFPGAAERIVAMTERQAEHRQQIERTVITTRARNETRAMYLGFILALVGVLGGLGLVYIGRDVSGLIAFFGALGGLIGITVFGRLRQRKELAEKRKPFEPGR